MIVLALTQKIHAIDLIRVSFKWAYSGTIQTLSNITKLFWKQLKRLITDYCIIVMCVYLDAIYIALRRDTVQKEAVYLIVGILENGSKEVLVYRVAPIELAYNLQEPLEEIQERGVIDVIFFISDGFKA